MAAPLLSLNGVSKHFGLTVRAVDDLSLEVQEGEVFSLLGPSGCGKTTTLRLIAGLEAPDSGQVLYQRVVIAWDPPRVFVPPDKRHMGIVFQSYAIFPHLTVLRDATSKL